ncbi:MAG: hypothetical protein LBQ88_13445 [Treponema sp.]|jgi:hypothetical protein|nr:hypothetical protein [Treponema sp.]
MIGESGCKTSVFRIREAGGRNATVLENGILRILADDLGGMIPELSYTQGTGCINAHWIPWFRANSGEAFSDQVHGSFWKGNLLYNIAGNFPCFPNFGPGHTIEGVNMPPHGWTANLKWNYLRSGFDEETGSIWSLSEMNITDSVFPLSFKKIDLLIPEHAVHYSSLRVKNRKKAAIEINAAWHNTLGPPFLCPGCRISAAAKFWASPPPGGEFDATTRLVPGAEFVSLSEVPLAKGGRVDLSRVPPPVGSTDFITGLIPPHSRFGWSALVNPNLKMAYICFFPGPKNAAGDDIILYFNNLWMQYGGRPFTPWASYEGGADLSYCLGTENSVSAFAYGLEYARKVKKVLGAPATVPIPGEGEKTLRYGTLFAPYIGNILSEGINSVEYEENAVIAAGRGSYSRFRADPDFIQLKKIEKLTALPIKNPFGADPQR